MPSHALAAGVRAHRSACTLKTPQMLREDAQPQTLNHKPKPQVLREGEHLISACGSPHYAAPEVILAKETGTGYRFECDMWAVGVICYTLLWYVSLQPLQPRLC